MVLSLREFQAYSSAPPCSFYPQPTRTCGAWAAEEEIKHPFDASLAAEWKRHSVCMCVFMDINTSESSSGTQRALPVTEETCVPPIFQLTQWTGRNDTTKYLMIKWIRDEEKKGGKRGWKDICWVGGQAGKAGKGVRLAKITHTNTHMQVSPPSGKLTTLPGVLSNQKWLFLCLSFPPFSCLSFLPSFLFSWSLN